MKKRLSKGSLSLLLLILMLALAACGMETTDENVVQGDGNTEEEVQDVDEQAEEPSAPEENKAQSEEFTIYYVDENIMEMVQEQQTITFTTEQEKIQALWNALQKPQDPEHFALWQGVELLDASLKEGTLTLNIAKPEQANVGAGGEAFAIQTLIDTFAQMDGVESIQITVDGQVVESLYGHVSIDKPFSKDEQIIQ